MAEDMAAVAVLLVNIWAALSGVVAARAWWPRHSLWPEPRSTKVFYCSVIGLMVAFGCNAALRAVDMLLSWPPALHLSSLDDLLWRLLGGAACVGMVWAKLLALPAEERGQWNMLTIVFHPDPDAIVVRICNAVARRMRRRKEL